MRKLRPIWMIGSVLSMVLTACTAAGRVPLATPSTAQPSQPVPPAATPLPSAEPLGVSVPAIEYANGRNELLLASSVTGKALEPFAPIPLSENYNYAFAPDGHTMAVVSGAQLYLIDLPTWKYRTSDVGLHGWLSAVVYSPDGTLLAMASGDPDASLRIVDAKSGEVKASAQAGFSVRNVKFTTDGKAIMVYGPPVDGRGVSTGVPMAALFSASDLSLLWSVNLKGIRDGIFPKKADTTDIYQPGAAWFFSPAIAFAPKGDILYAVHGDEDKLTTVDFSKRKVSTLGVHVKTSWLDRLMALTAGVAHAKGMDGTTKQAVISPDGKYLYVVGSTEAVSKQANGTDWDVTDTYIGLQVIAVQGATLVDQKDTKASSLVLSPDGKYVLLNGWKSGTPAGWTEVYDMASQSIIKHLDDTNLIPTRPSGWNGNPSIQQHDQRQLVQYDFGQS